jgi:hypothetical protein
VQRSLRVGTFEASDAPRGEISRTGRTLPTVRHKGLSRTRNISWTHHNMRSPIGVPPTFGAQPSKGFVRTDVARRLLTPARRRQFG